MKDATADLARPIRTKLAIDKDFIMLSGEDGTALPFLAQGGVGCISVTSNVAPRLTAEMHKAWAEGDLKHAMKINERLMPVQRRAVLRDQPRPGEICRQPARPRVGRAAPAAGADRRSARSRRCARR